MIDIASIFGNANSGPGMTFNDPGGIASNAFIKAHEKVAPTGGIPSGTPWGAENDAALASYASKGPAKGPGVSFDQYLASGAFQPRWDQTWDGMRDLAKQIGYTGTVNDPASHQESGYYQDVMAENSTTPMWTSASSGPRGNWVGDEYGSQPRFVPDTTSPYETRTVKDPDTLNPDFQKAVNAKNYNFTHIPVGGNSNMGVYDGGTQVGRYNASSYENQRFEQFVMLALSAAGAAAGPIGSAIVNGAMTGMQGGDIGDILTSAAKSYAINTVGTTAAPYISNAAGSVGSAVGSELGSTAGDIAKGAVSGGARAAVGAGLRGGSILDAALQGAAGGGLSAGVNNVSSGYLDDLPKPLQNAVTSGATAALLGRTDPLHSAINSGLNSLIGQGFSKATTPSSDDGFSTNSEGNLSYVPPGYRAPAESDPWNPDLSTSDIGVGGASSGYTAPSDSGWGSEPVQQVNITAPRPQYEPFYPADEQTEVRNPYTDPTAEPVQQVKIIGAKPSTPNIISTPPTGQPTIGSKTPAKGSNSGIDMNSLLAMMMLMNKDDQQPQTPYHLADVSGGKRIRDESDKFLSGLYR